jgi:RecB family exonuclease
MSAQDMSVAAPGLPRLSPSRLEAWDRCPAAYRFEYVLRLPQPIGDQRPRLLGSVAHALLEDYLQESLRMGERPPSARVAESAAGLLEQDGVPGAGGDLIREATGLVTRWLAQWTVPVESIVAVERALAVDQSGTHVAWDAADAFIRGRLDLVAVAGSHATVLDWKSGWVSEDEEGLRVAWAPGLYAALLWAWAPRLEQISVEYHYLRTGRVARVVMTRADAVETLAWARALAFRIALALATPEDPAAFPPRPSTACGTCPWVNRCPAGHAALEAMAEGPIADGAEARRLGGLLLAGEARVGRLRERLKQYLQDRAPLTFNGIELGFFPTKGRYDAAAVFRSATDAGDDPWPLLAADGRALSAFLKRQPGAERVLAGAWTATPPWFGHRKAKNATRGARDPNRSYPDAAYPPRTEPCSDEEHGAPQKAPPRLAPPRAPRPAPRR